jgi:hypothetical protein
MTSMPNETHGLNETGTWLPLMDYSTKYKVSVSTLRRRIKAEDIKFRLDDGKYFIVDEPMSTHQRLHRPSLDSDPAQVGAHQVNETALNTLSPKTDISDKIAMAKNDEPILTAANKLLTELKKAYTLILHEKEEQIFQLKDEVTDLKTLVRVLESENERLKNYKQ